MTSATPSNKSLTAQEHSIAKVFSDDFVFEIPEYQRPYSWTKEHAGDLLNDLLDTLGEENGDVAYANPYFLGSIVLVKGAGSKAKVVDGQQRLTTLAILLAAVRELAAPEHKNLLEKYLYQEEDPFGGHPAQYRLTLRPQDRDFFREYVQREGGFEKLETLEGASLSDSQENIRENSLHLKDELSDYPDQQEKLAQFILQKCFLVVVSTPDLDSAYRIFSVLNDRGMDLSHADILKAETIGKISDETQRGKYAREWEDIEEELGRDPFQNLFGHIRMIYRKAKPKDTLLEEFRKHVAPSNDPRGFIDDILNPMAEVYNEIINADYSSAHGTEEVNRLLGWLNRIDNSDWIPPAILYLKSNRNNPELLKRFLTELERLAAGVMILRYNINQRLLRYGQVLSAIERGEELFEAESPLQLTGEERRNILQTLDGGIYRIPRVPRYVLLRLDEDLSGGEASYNYKIISIEHVLPQNPPQNSQWLEWFSEEERLRHTHRLGNLVLLARKKNGQAGNFDFERKKNEYFQRNGVTHFPLTTQVVQYDEWTPEVVEERQEDLLERLRKVWRL